MNASVEMTANQVAQDFSQVADGTPMLVNLASLVEVSHKNVRRKRDPQKFAELVEDVKKSGVTQAIAVRPHPDDSAKLEVLAGYGRWKASLEAGLTQIPATIKQVNDTDAFAIMLNENLIREDLSLVDEARASQDFVSLYNGDYEQAAEHLGWTTKKVRQRLELMNCHDDVLEALQEGKIKLGHATVLCSFTHKTQLGTLAKIVETGMSVDELKQRASQASQSLAKAPFDKTDCEACAFNTEKQAGLFQESMSQGMCTKRSCYMGKLQEWAEQRKVELGESYNKVFLALEKPASDRKTVSPEVVGHDQFTQGCQGCESCAAVLEVMLPNTGQVIENQCVDLGCHKKQVKKWEDAQRIPVTTVESNASQTPANTDQPASVATGKQKKQPVAQSTPKAVIEAHRAYLREQGANAVQSKVCFARGFALYSMMKLVEGHEIVAKILGAETSQLRGTMSAVVRFMAGCDDKSLAQATMAIVKHAAHDAKDREGVDMTNLMMGMVADENAQETAKTNWKPTAEVLKAYLKNRLISICEESGFAKAYDQAKAEGSFKKLAAGKKGDLEAAILGFDFDWSGYAPSELTELIPSPID